jgi:hypothetical protein
MTALAFGIAALLLIAWKPQLPLSIVVTALAVVGIAIGTCYPVGTVSIQNAVAQHQLGIAMGAMNFFRSLGSALLVAIMGAIVLAGYGAAPQRGGGSANFAATLHSFGGDPATVFAWVFVSAAICLVLGIIAFAMMEERPLRTTITPAPGTGVAANPGAATPAPSATPAE